jgi:hypothetical protein
MVTVSTSVPVSGGVTGPHYSGAEAAVAVAECGLASWREAKAAWLRSLADFEMTGASDTRTSTQRGAASARRTPRPRR